MSTGEIFFSEHGTPFCNRLMARFDLNNVQKHCSFSLFMSHTSI